MYRLVGLCRSDSRSYPRSSPAVSLNWAGEKVLLPRLCGLLSRTCNEQRCRTTMVVTHYNM
ncbi:hypothetical protein T4B_948 [Trichinella pseudospiralis]|uniref:Uncharacterized protein n=1 Tax=Trichinella pseudospiralis TaxID=6337 RepID=A0A0V1K2H2_TRIPS|nr:hypothetical protein T4A_4161 [Trichinella pseudospiralis]KRZ33465.1 hypothetical protein T4B_948 [Trichinella pseudospiralis]KRZ41256.1 hypothetical protein T4C_11289 [Trichinella pseudospiralis]